MTDGFCPIHKIQMKQWTKGDRSWYSHMVAEGEWCSGGDPKEPLDRKLGAEKADTLLPVDWDAKDRQSMAQTAMKAASEVLAAMIKAGFSFEQDEINKELKDMANQYYIELKRIKDGD